MRPYPENTFDILVTILRNSNAPINASVEIVEKYVNAAVLLHNYLRQTETAAYCPSGFVDFQDSSGNIQPGYWREYFHSKIQPLLSNLQPARGSRYIEHSVGMRDGLKNYVNIEKGCISWQWDSVTQT